MSRIDVVLVTYNSAHRLEACIRALKSFFDFDVDRLHVVDNASTDDSVALLECLMPDAVFTRNPENVGFARAVNLALSISEADVVALVNPDVGCVRGDVTDILELIRQDDVGAVAVKMVDENGELQRSCHRYPGPLSVISESLALRRRFPDARLLREYRMLDWDMSTQADVEDSCGGFLFLSRRALLEAGLLDERYFMYYEETDWLRRAGRLGFRVVYTPDVEVVHAGGGSSEGVAGNHLHAMLLRSAYLYLRKWYGPVATACVRVTLGFLDLLRLAAAPFRTGRNDTYRAIIDRLRVHIGLR